MIICEAAILTILTVLLIVCCYSDCISGLIQNRNLLRAAIPAALLDAVYYKLFAVQYLSVFAQNAGILIVLAICFYCYNLWGAGDSKLLIVVGLCVPGRLYTLWDSPLSSSFTIVIIVFSSAFLYVVVESVILGLLNRDILSWNTKSWNLWEVLMSYLTMLGVLTLINYLLSPMISRFPPAIFAAVNFLLVLTLIHIRGKLSHASVRIALFFIWIALIIIMLWNRAVWRIIVHYKTWLAVFLIMLFRVNAEKYNYIRIRTEDIRSGQILSAGTILGFAKSRVRGLPVGCTEDLRSRLTSDEADAVRRWGKSKHGQPWIVIVRKMPFAIFIAFGSAVFVMLEVIMS